MRTLLFKKVHLVENSSQLSRSLNQDKSFSSNPKKKSTNFFLLFALYTIFIRIYPSLSDLHSISAMQLHRCHIIIGFISDRLPRSGHHSSVYFKVLKYFHAGVRFHSLAVTIRYLTPIKAIPNKKNLLTIGWEIGILQLCPCIVCFPATQIDL